MRRYLGVLALLPLYSFIIYSCLNLTALNFVCLYFPSECFLPRLVRPLLGTKQTMRSHICLVTILQTTEMSLPPDFFNFASDKWYFFRLSTAKKWQLLHSFFSFCLWGGDREGLPYPRNLNQSINKVTVLCVTYATLKNELIFHKLQSYNFEIS